MSLDFAPTLNMAGGERLQLLRPSSLVYVLGLGAERATIELDDDHVPSLAMGAAATIQLPPSGGGDPPPSGDDPGGTKRR